MSYSGNGITWATPFKVSNDHWTGVAVNPSGRFVAFSFYGSIYYSNDGITWATSSQVAAKSWYGIASNLSGRFVAVGLGGYIAYSGDGITWVTPFRVGTAAWYGIAVNSSGIFVAVGDASITHSLPQDSIQISSNGGTTWGSDTLIPQNGAISITGFGIDILFGNFTGHTVGNYWSFKQGAMRGLVITDSAGNEYFSASSGVIEQNGVIKQNGMAAYACRAWVRLDGTGTVSVKASANVSSVVDGGTGYYIIIFADPMPDTNYAAIAYASYIEGEASVWMSRNNPRRQRPLSELESINISTISTIYLSYQ